MSELHKGHRKRLRDKYNNDGIDNFADHEILELLLYYALPQRNTNPLAHELLEKTGSLSALFDAPYAYLRKLGLSENTATLIKLIPDLARVYIDDKQSKSKIISSNSLCEYFQNKFIGRNVEVLHLLLLDNKRKELFSGVVSKGTLKAADVPTRKIIELCVLHDAKFAVLAHNHVVGFALPSTSDLKVTKMLYKSMDLVGVRLLDHIIVSDNDSISLANSIYARGVFVSE